MSLILGIYSKKGDIAVNDLKEVLEDFSLKGKRKIRSEQSNRIIFSMLKAEHESTNITENEDNSLIILFAGYVYDFKEDASELSKKGHIFKNGHSPAEFILHSYEEYGESFLKELNGNFTFAIFNKKNNSLILANDSFGIYPLFIYDSDEVVIFSSEYEPITKYKKFNNALNCDAIAEYFTLGVPLGDKTFFKNINNLRQGSILNISREKSISSQYDDLNIHIDRNKSIKDFAENISECFHKAVKARVKNVFCCSLTGGADTRLILSNLSEKDRKSISFYCSESTHLKPKEDKDILIAMRIAERLGLKLEIKKFIERDSAVSLLDDVRIVSPEKKTLKGVYGGEFLGGCCFEVAPIKTNSSSKELYKNKIQKIFSKKPKEQLKTIFSKKLIDQLKMAFSGEPRVQEEKVFSEQFLRNISDPKLTLTKEIESIKVENREFYFCIQQMTRGFLTNIYGGSFSGWAEPYRIITKADTPFLDKNLLKALLTIPKKYLLNYNLYNLIYKNHFPELIDIPTNSGLSARKDSCMTYIDEGVEPKSLLEPENSNLLTSYLGSNKTWNKQFYNEEYIKSKEDNDPLISQFLDFEAWYRKAVLEET